MEASSYINALEEFFREEYIKEIERLAELFPEKRSLDVDFFRLDKYNPELADELLERPDVIIKAAEEAIAGMNIVNSQGQTLTPNVRFFNLPEHRQLLIRNINSTHINKLIAIDGVITKITDVRPKINVATFECRRCGRQYRIPQNKSLFGRLEEPETCSCGRKDFSLVVDESQFIDMQKMEVQEPLEALVRGEQAKNITVWLEDDLTNRLYAGDKIEVTGILRLIPPKNKGSVYSVYLQAVHVQQKETEFEEIEITEEEEKQILELAKDPNIYEKIVASIAPTIYGHKEIKEALALQLLGGTRGKKFPDKTTRIRPDIHILLIGDPGTAKCVTGDTEVLMKDGSLVRIGEEVDRIVKRLPTKKIDDGVYAEINHDVLSLGLNGKNEYRKANIAWKRKAPETMVEITTATGRRINVTPTHPLFICYSGLVGSKKAHDVHEGEFIATPRKIPVFGTPQLLENIRYTRARSRNRVKLKLPKSTGVDFWRFVAFIIGEGYMKKRGPCAHVTFTNNEKSLIEEFIRYSKHLGMNPRITKKGQSLTVVVNSIELYSFLESLGVKGTSKNKEVPHLLFRCSKEEISAFLSAIFDCEATVSKKEREIVFVTASEKLIRQIQHLLLRFGIISQAHETISRATNSKQKPTKYFKLRISGRDVLLFRNYIGFGLEKKRKLLENLCTVEKKFNTNMDVIPNLSQLLKEIRIALDMPTNKCGIPEGTYKHIEKGERNPSRETLGKILDAFRKRIQVMKYKGMKIKKLKEIETCIEILKKLTWSDIFWDRIVSKRVYSPKEKWVYDLQVPGVHNFIANDIYVHNSMLLDYIYRLAPKAVFVGGKSASSAGLTATAEKDEFGEGGWTLKAGALVLASGGQACLLPNSKVVTGNGTIEIERLFEEKDSFTVFSNGERQEINERIIEVNTFDLDEMRIGKGISTKVRRKWYKGEIVEMELTSGFKIRVTPDHMLIDGSSLKWKKAGEFNVGEYLLAPLRLEPMPRRFVVDILPEDWFIELNEKSRKEFEKDTKMVIGKRIKVGEFKIITKRCGCYEKWASKRLTYSRKYRKECIAPFLDEDLGYLIGFIYGDGNVGYNKRRSEIHIYQSPVNGKQIEKIKRTWEKVTGEELNERIRRIKHPSENVYICGYDFHKGNFLLGEIYKQITENGFEKLIVMPKGFIRGFFAGLMDSDGCISVKKCIKNGKRYKTVHIEFNVGGNENSNLGLLLGLRVLDVYGAYRRKKGKSAITITGRTDTATLLKELSELSVKIKDIPKRKHLVSSTSDKLPMQVVCDIVNKVYARTCKTELLKKGIWSTVYNYAHVKYPPSREQLQKIRYLGGVDKDVAEDIDRLLQRDFFIDKIKKIEMKKYEGYVYDLFVPGYNNFVADGVIVHNCIDEFDKMGDEDRSAMHEAMEQQRISIAKAGIVTTFKSETAILAAANPKFGRFDPYSLIAEQFDIPPTLLSRFDLIFPIRDVMDKERDMEMAEHILSAHQVAAVIGTQNKEVMSEEEFKEAEEKITPALDQVILRKYIAYARKHIFPILTKEVMEKLEEYYVELRRLGKEQGSVAATPRQLEALIRLSEASAKGRLSTKVEIEDAERAIRLHQFVMREIGVDRETGRFDIDIITTGQPKSRMDRARSVYNIIKHLSKEHDEVSKDMILNEVRSLGIEENELNNILSMLKKNGDIYSPKYNFFRIVEEK
ncbi:MAG: helix-turn-helix domain-containing protein [Candidatus Diapherotrites archaeon]|nr:helix-turn-helix domain-containing protein [Candidatus Diapherotrites archaeon]